MPQPFHNAQHQQPQQPHHAAGQHPQPPPIGRSQSAFNFLLSKAKIPFSSSSSSSTLNTSNSLSSLSGQHDDPFVDSTNHLQYHRQLQQQYPAPHGPSMASLGRGPAPPPAATVNSVPRSSTSDAYSGKPGSFGTRPSISDEASISSPTKRGFFAGMGRDRKVSNASAGKSSLSSAKNGFGHSPLGRGLRQDSGGSSSYALYSKSQSDLHARADFPSPTGGTVELPKMPLVYAQNVANADRAQFLRSPSPVINFSRSVDDLAAADVSPFPVSPSPLPENGQQGQIGGNWGEQGIVNGGDWRPSDMGTLASPSHHSRDGQGHSAPGSARSEAGFKHVPLSAAPSHQPGGLWPVMPPPNTNPISAGSGSKGDGRKHARKASKLNHLGGGREAAANGKGAVAGTLAMSLGLAGIGQTNAGNVKSSPAGDLDTLPPGAVFQGFLSRNTQISLTLAQLTESESTKGKDKEKDISKGWKPYRVVLQDGKLYFFKPPSSISDEVKTLFPTGIVWGGSDAASASQKGPGSNYAKDLGIDADGIMKSGLGKNDLLLATSSNKDGTSSQSSPSFGPVRYKGLGGRRTPVRADSVTTVLTAEPDAITSAAIARPNPSDAWARPGRHAALFLVEVAEAPGQWVERVQNASPEALADEYVRATQLPEPTYGEDTENQSDAFAVTALLSTASVSPQCLSTFLEEVAQLAKTSRQNDDRTQSASQQRLSRLIEIALDLGLPTASQDFADAISRLQACAAGLGPDSGVRKKLEVTAVQERPRPVPTDWLNPEPRKLSTVRPELEKMLANRTITGDVLLQLDPLEVAQQIQTFHSDRLRTLGEPGISVIDLLDPSLDSSVAVLSFDSHVPHYLSLMVLSHLIGAAEAEQGPTLVLNQSGARHRASLLRHWIAVASYLLNLGDVCGWLAVAVALCSRAVTRLEQTWRYLAEGDRLLVSREWAPQLAKIAWAEGVPTELSPIFKAEEGQSRARIDKAKELRVVPFLGNAPVHLRRAAARASGADPKAGLVNIASCAKQSSALLRLSQRWTSAWQNEEAPIAAVDEAIVEYQLCLQVAQQRASDVKPSQWMERSFRLEPQALGNVLAIPPAASSSRSATAQYALVPLLFPMPLPHLSLIDAQKILEGTAGPERRPRQTGDQFATITQRTLNRPGMAGSPLVRSSAFSPPLSNRPSRPAAFIHVPEWSSGAGAAEDSSNLMRIGNELVLRTLQEPSLSVPSSPMTGKRFSQDFGRSSRPLSQVSKRSSLPASNRSSVIEVVVPVQVVVKSATLDRMIDVLVMGVQHINVKGSEDTTSTEGTPRKIKLGMDMDSYRSTFLATFRSLCTPRELFQQLQKRFVAAVNASKEMALLDTYQISSQFPSWVTVTPAGSHVEPIDWEVVYRIRIGVVTALRQWIDRFPQDFADDDALYQSVHAFLREPGLDKASEDPDYAKIALSLAQINGMFVQSILSANARSDERGYVLPSPVYAKESIDAVEINFDAISSEELVDFLESIATVFFDKIVERDLLVVGEIFERQAMHPTAWYAARHSDNRQPDEDKAVNSMYSLLDILKVPGSTSKDPTLQQRLPAAVRDALAAQSLLRGWVAIHIIEQGLGVERRQARLEKLLDAVWICRARMSRLRSEDGATLSQDASAPFREATVGSFVESAILGSLTSSESRIFLRAWQGVAISRSSTGDNLSDLFPVDIAPQLRAASAGSSTPDVGWMLSCLAEAVTRASPAPDGGPDVALVDFEQKRTLWGIIEGAIRVRPPCNSPALIDLAGARLKAMQTALANVTWDRRAFREDAAREASQAAPISPQANLRQSSSGKALPGLSRQQQEKMRRDRGALNALDSTAAMPPISSRLSSMQSAQDRGQPAAASASPIISTPSSATTTIPDKTTIRARRMTALFGRAVRPLISDKSEQNFTRPVEELMRLTPMQKPSLVAGLGGAQLAPWKNSQRSFVLHLTSEEGAKYLLQAPNQAELNQWYTHISRTAKERAPRRPMDLRKGATGKHAVHGPAVAPLYGVPLPVIVEREGSAVPMAIEKMFAEIEARGLREQGIYRISGAKSAIEGLRSALNKQPLDTIDLSHGEFSDVNTIAGAIKHWFRDLPEPVITFASYDAIIAAERIEGHDERLSTIREIIWSLPKCHFDLLRRTAEHLARVVDEGTYNLMAPHNIGLVFGTSLLNPPPGPSSVALSFGNLGKAAHIVKIIVTMHEWLFEPEPEPELELEAEAEATTEALPDTEPDEQPGSEQNIQFDDDGREQIRLEPADPLAEAEPLKVAGNARRHTYMLGGLGLGTEQLKELKDAPDPATSLSASVSMQRSFSSDSEPLTPVERFEDLSPGPSPLPSMRKLASPSSPLPPVPDEKTMTGSTPAIVLTSTDEVDGSELQGAVLGRDAGDAEVDDSDSGDDDQADLSSPASRGVTSDRPSDDPVPTTSSGATTLEVTGQGARPRVKRTRGGNRDSVFSSYSIYADCFDNLNLGAAPPASASPAAAGRQPVRLDASADSTTN